MVNVVDDCLCVKNNKKAKTGVVSTHTGLSNLNQRSKLFSGHEINIVNEGAYFLVKVKLMK